ncbi:MAG: hypothetical protein PW788_13720 [Micavibrio sp.]|nr:hypothetical protein [Micavibrio sp.]
MNEREITSNLNDYIILVATILKIEDSDTKHASKLKKEIEKFDPKTAKALKKFIKAYKSWGSLPEKHCGTSKGVAVVMKKDKTREQLVKRLNKVR